MIHGGCPVSLLLMMSFLSAVERRALDYSLRCHSLPSHDAIPEDMLELILSHLTPMAASVDLLAAQLTCRKWRAVARAPILWRHVRITSRALDAELLLEELVKRLLENAAHIQTFEIVVGPNKLLEHHFQVAWARELASAMPNLLVLRVLRPDGRICCEHNGYSVRAASAPEGDPTH